MQRIRELFSQNISAGDSHKILIEEGWEIDAYRFRKLRSKNGMLFRNEKGYVPTARMKRSATSNPSAASTDAATTSNAAATSDKVTNETDLPLPPEEQARRAQRLVDLQVQSDELLRTRKRRRRIRGYGHLPPDDASVPPRYGSETSLDECKTYLQLSNETYTHMRSQFDAICQEMGIIKMSTAAEGQWQIAKDRLVRENAHLSAMLHPLQPDIDKRVNALNCICMDVTKRKSSLRHASREFERRCSSDRDWSGVRTYCIS